MAVTLHLDRRAWFDHLGSAWPAFGDLVPVVKGNGYGIGRDRLARIAIDLGADEVAVGTIHEISSVPPGPTITVLTPALAPEVGPDVRAALTVGSTRHVGELVDAGFRGAVVIELATPLRRFGVDPGALGAVLAATDAAGLGLHAFGLHFPLASTSADHAGQVAAWLPRLPAGAPVHVSHVGPTDLAELRRRHPDRRVRARVGTDLWHGDKSFFRLGVDVLDRRPLPPGARAGYRLVVPRGPSGAGDSDSDSGGHLITVSGGTAHGVHPLAPDGRSPFHFRHTRLALVEPPHMHTSMLFVAEGEPVPEVGDELDLQRPLTQTWPDRVIET